MVHEPQVVELRIKFIFLILRGWIVVILAVIVSNTQEDWSAWEIFGERLLHSPVGLH